MGVWSDDVLPSRLIDEWKLDADNVRHMNEREGHWCESCRGPLRVHPIARALLEECERRFGLRARSVRQLVGRRGFRELRTAEINIIHGLHDVLAKHPGHSYSEYGSTDPKIPSEDLTALSYADHTFDFVFTSDTLEHVPDLERCFAEIHRVLKPDGVHIFTIPVIWDRQTLCRAEVIDGEVVHREPASFHGITDPPPETCLVFHEFGADVEATLRGYGYDLQIDRHGENPLLTAFRTRSPKSS